MNITVLPLGRLGTNCYILSDGDKKAAVIDPACDGERIVSLIAENGLTPEAILLTHAHYDHIMAIDTLFSHWDHITLFLHSLDREALRDPSLNLSAFFGGAYSCQKEARPLSDGDVLHVGRLSFRVLHTPGHTAGSVCYLSGDALFSGDTLFQGSVGRTDFPGGNSGRLRESLQRLARLKGDLRVFPGHGDSTTLDRERKYNPYMR